MNNIITVKTRGASGHLTCLRRLEPALWEWDGSAVSAKRMAAGGGRSPELFERYDQDGMLLRDGIEYNRLDSEGLQSYIEGFEWILKNKDKKFDLSDYIKWENNEAQIRVSGSYSKRSEMFYIYLEAQNLSRLHWPGEEVVKQRCETIGTLEHQYTPEWHGHDGMWMGNSLMVDEEDLKQYIDELKAEYERETGKAYKATGDMPAVIDSTPSESPERDSDVK